VQELHLYNVFHCLIDGEFTGEPVVGARGRVHQHANASGGERGAWFSVELGAPYPRGFCTAMFWALLAIGVAAVQFHARGKELGVNVGGDGKFESIAAAKARAGEGGSAAPRAPAASPSTSNDAACAARGAPRRPTLLARALTPPPRAPSFPRAQARAATPCSRRAPPRSPPPPPPTCCSPSSCACGASPTSRRSSTATAWGRA
jgi:hypothetical protein